MELELESRNLVPKFSEYKAYIKNYTIYDAGGWVPINRNGLAYLMDPRNYLSERYIFAFEDARSDHYSDTTVRKMFEGNSDLTALIPDLIEAAKVSGLNPSFLGARMKGEISEGDGIIDSAKGERVVDGKSGYYNLFNIGAYAGESPRDNGIRYAMGIGVDAEDRARYRLPWDSARKALIGGAIWIYDHYVDESQYNHYYQKYSVRDGAIWHQYMQNAFAPLNESSSQYKAYVAATVLPYEKVFRIPVYRDMNSAAAPHPSEADGAWWKLGAEAWTTTLPFAKPTPKPTPTATPEPGEATGERALGDPNGDAKWDVFDMLLIEAHIVGRRSLSGEALKAADVNEDGNVNVFDLLRLEQHIVGVKKLA